MRAVGVEAWKSRLDMTETCAYEPEVVVCRNGEWSSDAEGWTPEALAVETFAGSLGSYGLDDWVVEASVSLCISVFCS